MKVKSGCVTITADYRGSNTDNMLHVWPWEKSGIISINMNNGQIMNILLSIIGFIYITHRHC